MSMIDRQRVAAVRKLEAMGCAFAVGDWMQPAQTEACQEALDRRGIPFRLAHGQAIKIAALQAMALTYRDRPG